MWESKAIPDGISRTYKERGGARKHVKSTKELLLFPDLFPRFRKRFEISNLGKRTHIFTKESAKDYKFSGTDGKPTVIP